VSTFTKPHSLNGQQLRLELRSAGIAISDDTGAVADSADGFIHLDIAAKDESKAEQIVAAHVGVDSIFELTLEEKLASINISLAEIKAALSA
jgi:hypothetical protein